MATVNTVRGPVDSARLGVTRTHEHLICDAEAIPARFGFDPLDNEALAVVELSAFKATGGGAIVELTLPEIGRDPLALRRISEMADVHVVMGCGWYRQPYYPPEVERTTSSGLAKLLIEEIENGVAATGIRPGIIGEIGSHKGWLTGSEERVFRAAARAALTTGLSVSTHSVAERIGGEVPVGLVHLEIMQEEGLSPSRVVVGHSDAYLNPDYHLAIARSGATVGYDQIGYYRSEWWESNLVGIITALVAEGYADRIVLSSDVDKKPQLRAFGGPGFTYISDVFIPRLRKVGVDEAAIQAMLVETPRRILEPQPSHGWARTAG
jgi:predicted metal-dependent phosphotriesterase family hydrolase